MCGCVCVLEGLRGVPVALLLLSGKLSWSFFFSDSPLWRQVQLHKYTLSFPCWQLSLLFMSTRREKAEHLMWTCHKDCAHSNFIWKWRTFLPQRWELLCSLILFDWPSFDLDKKGMREPPGGSLWVWRHYRILFALWATAEGLLHRCIQRDCCADPKCCKRHLLGDWLAQRYFTQIFLSRPE